MPLSDGITSRVWPRELIHLMFPGVFGTDTLGGRGWATAGRTWSVILAGGWTRAGVVRPAVCCSICETVSDWRDFVRTITCAEELGVCTANTHRLEWRHFFSPVFILRSPTYGDFTWNYSALVADSCHPNERTQLWSAEAIVLQKNDKWKRHYAACFCPHPMTLQLLFTFTA